jgi:hypothetical protein
VLIDVLLPLMDGRELVLHRKELPDPESLRIVFDARRTDTRALRLA